MILDYSEYLIEEDTQSFCLNQKLFYYNYSFCPFCRCSTSQVDHKDLSHEKGWAGFDSFEEKFSVYQCDSCGWWEVKHYKESYNYYGDPEPEMINSADIKRAILRSYDPKDIALPISVLRNALISKKDYIYKIHPQKMEELVQSVFSDFYDCKVEHCGGSGDGGIDLFLLNSDKPTMIQVKRRTKPNSVEAVSEIREFLGAVVLGQGQKCIFVTTAKKFSNPAIKSASKAVENKTVEQFDLYNFDKFMSILNLVRNQPTETWKMLRPDWYDSI
ncbi:restriction endonuclease [Laspinema sp. D1]|uniref:Restriction endonuclease n=1 Tax=Laspinema palackyanum D2a TaxID=2953684 RepID=A0ABT2N0G9_9CYAN|nr:restriction endonuclease [Laspinema sp. D2a]